MLTLAVVAAIVLYTDLVRFRSPVGEKYVPVYPPGQVDFGCAYLGARALLAGVNPYHNDRPEFTHPVFGITPVEGVGYKVLYPPGQMLLYVPLALWHGPDSTSAGKFWFHLNLIALLALTSTIWVLAGRIAEAGRSGLTPLWIPFLGICMALNTGVELGLERGQSEIVTALMCWGATACYLRGRSGTAVFLSIWGASIKGYPILFVAGIGLLALGRPGWKRAIGGGVLAIVILVIPVLRYLGDALRGMRSRSEMFWAVWYNHSFRNAAYEFLPAWAARGRTALSGLAFLVTVAAWIQARRVFKRGTPAERALWLTVFTTAALGTMIGYSALSISYNLILVLPGALILVLGQQRLGSHLVLSQVSKQMLGAALLVATTLLFVYRLGGEMVPLSTTGHAASAFGLVILFFILGVVLVRALRCPVGAP